MPTATTGTSGPTDRSRPLRVGVVGVGWGAHVQVPAYRAADGFDPVALCARTPERLSRVAERLGIADTSTDWRSLVGGTGSSSWVVRRRG